MRASEVPQEDNTTLDGHLKGIYARDADGNIRMTASRGWQVEETVTRQALDEYLQLAAAARLRARSGQGSPLEYHMYKARMDEPLLAQSTGLWRWRVRRHLRPEVFRRLSPALLARYADALGIDIEQLRGVD